MSEHRPVVCRGGGDERLHYLVCGECGLLLDFRPLEEIGVKTDDWRDLPDITEANEYDGDLDDRDAHAEGLHDDVPREGCPICEDNRVG